MKIKLVNAKPEDAVFILHLKNQSYVRNASYSTRKILLKEHLKWFGYNYKYFKIICLGVHQIGYVRVHKGDSTGDIHIALLKEHQNKGIGTKIIKIMAKIHKSLRTQVLLSNKSSIRMFEKAGFKKIGVVMRK